MTHEKAIAIILETALCTKLGNKMPSYNALSKEHQCSRVVFQKAIKDLETQDIIVLEKAKSGNILIDLDYDKILEQYYSKLYISCPQTALLNSQDELTIDIITKLNNINSSLYFTYSNSAYKRISALENNIVNFAIVSNQYYHKLANNNYMIFAQFPIKSPTYTEFSRPKSDYILEELPVLHASDNSNTPSEYNLICTTATYNLLNNLT